MRDYDQMTDPNEYPPQRPPSQPPPAPPYYPPPGPYYAQPWPVVPPTNGMATPAMVLGIIGLLIWPLAPVALLMAHGSLSQMKKSGERGEGQAITGAILGWLVTAPWLVFLVVAAIGAIVSAF